MGEQSAKHPRPGDDVIFNGSEHRGPHGMAEVTLSSITATQKAPRACRSSTRTTPRRHLDGSSATAPASI